jgi:hypothetical protein
VHQQGAAAYQHRQQPAEQQEGASAQAQALAPDESLEARGATAGLGG